MAARGTRSHRGARRARPAAAVRVARSPAPAVGDGLVRLNRFLASAGLCSRRRADELIAHRRVTVNGEIVVELGRRIDPSSDVVRYEGRKIEAEKPVYVLFNKPRDVVCTNARHEVRRRAIDFLENVRGRIYTVGRLDAESEGLLLLTNDGEFAQKLAHPRYGVPKTYAVLVRGRPEPEHLEKARGGVWLAEGRTGRTQIRVERRGRDRSYLKITLREGRNREIRRVFARLGYPVLALKRVRIGALSLHGLKPGAHRFLRPDEVRGLLASAQEGS
jgi:23S rRNA pseudouridine2605 synthase